MSVVEHLVAESLRSSIPAAVRRDLEPLYVPRKADVLVGMRRSGKTYAMFDAMGRLLDRGVDRQRLLYLNLDDDRIAGRDASVLSEALDAFQRLSPQARENGSYLFLDEIQVVSGWERFARRVVDTDPGQLILGGSSSKMLSADVATAFRGRGVTTEVLPYSFREYLRASGGEYEGDALPVSQTPEIEAAADDYLRSGGFPETLGVPPLVRPQLLQGYVESVVMRDVIERHGIENVSTLRHLISAIFAANAGPFSVSRLVGSLRAQGHRTTKVTLMKYLDYLVDAFLLFVVPIDSRSEKKRLVNPRKVYSIDSGLAAVMYAGGAVNRGALLENAVYIELRRRLGPLGAGRIAYHRTPSGREIDFVTDPPLAEGRREFFQVCWSIEEPATRERETLALAEAMQSHPGSTATLITRLEEGELQTASGTARVVPFWRWALGKP